MILVTVCQNYATKFVEIFSYISDVRDYCVYSRTVVSGELNPAVHDDNVVIILYGGHIFANFANTAKKNDSYCFCHIFPL